MGMTTMPTRSVSKGQKSTAKIAKQPWPKMLPERMVAIQTALQRHDGPADSAKIAAYYTRASKAEVSILLETLVAVGNVRQLDDGRFALYKPFPLNYPSPRWDKPRWRRDHGNKAAQRVFANLPMRGGYFKRYSCTYPWNP